MQRVPAEAVGPRRPRRQQRVAGPLVLSHPLRRRVEALRAPAAGLRPLRGRVFAAAVAVLIVGMAVAVDVHRAGPCRAAVLSCGGVGDDDAGVCLKSICLYVC